MINVFICECFSNRMTWLGLYKSGSVKNCPNPCREGWQWRDGSPVTFTKWARNEPSSSGDYAIFMRNDGSSWFADPLKISRPFICERGTSVIKLYYRCNNNEDKEKILTEKLV